MSLDKKIIIMSKYMNTIYFVYVGFLRTRLYNNFFSFDKHRHILILLCIFKQNYVREMETSAIY